MSRARKTCKWHMGGWSEGQYWETSCGAAHTFILDGPKENKYEYCCYCGGKLKLNKEP